MGARRTLPKRHPQVKEQELGRCRRKGVKRLTGEQSRKCDRTDSNASAGDRWAWSSGRKRGHGDRR